MFVSDGTGPMAKELNNLEVDNVAIDWSTIRYARLSGPSQSSNFDLTFDFT